MKRKTVDLHIHSNYSSDGTFSVHELFRQAGDLHMDAIIIADHDTWEAYKEAGQEAARTGIRTLPAVELSCIDEGRMVHILGYGIDTKKRHKLWELTELIRKSRIDILPDIKKNLEEEGFLVDMDVVRHLAAPRPPVITNFAQAILDDPRNQDHPGLLMYRPGQAKSDRPYIRFIKDYLVAGQKCYVPEYTVDIYTGIQAIAEAGGVPVLAHPGEWFTAADEVKIPGMMACGLIGVEVFTPYHTTEQQHYFAGLAEAHGLFVTAGSDYHDERKKPGHVMGMVPAADMAMFLSLRLYSRAKRYKLLAIDVDGTLLDDQHRLSEENVRTIRIVQQAGVKVVLFSGRGYSALQEIILKLGLKEAVVTQNGSLIMDCRGEQVLHRAMISPDDCMEILNYCRDIGADPLIYQGDAVYSKLSGHYLDIFETCMDQKVTYTEDLEACYGRQPLGKILILDQPERVRQIQDWISAHFNHRVKASRAYDYSLEIGGSTKGDALEWLASCYNIRSEEIMAIGDGENDMEMLAFAGLGVAMQGAMERVRQSAKYVTGSNNENGVAYAIKHFM